MTGLLGEVDLPAPVSDRWFEDYVPGSVYEFGYASLSQMEIVAFVRHYDPQSIHTDPAWSATGPFGGLIASGVHTDRRVHAALRRPLHLPGSQPGLGLDELRWPRPCDPATNCTSASRSPRRVPRAPNLTGDSCAPPSSPSTRTTRSCCRSLRSTSSPDDPGREVGTSGVPRRIGYGPARRLRSGDDLRGVDRFLRFLLVGSGRVARSRGRAEAHLPVGRDSSVKS